MDQVNLLGNILNSYKFSCRFANEAECAETRALRESPFFKDFLRLVEDIVDEKVRKIGETSVIRTVQQDKNQF